MDAQSSEQQPVDREALVGVKVMMEVMQALAKSGAPAGYRVVYRTNPRGEHVVAVVWPPRTP